MTIVDSVAAVFCCQGRVFAVRRQSHLDFFPGYDSFPGGKIDRDDSRLQHPARFLCDFDGQKMHALVRELREELDFDLPSAIESGQVTAVSCLARVLAPPLVAVRFHLHVFRIDLKAQPLFTLDSGEIEQGFWTTPYQLLEQFAEGNSLMVPPLRRVLEALKTNPQAVDFGDLSPQYDEKNYVARFELLSEVQVLPIPSHSFPPEKRTNAFLLGDENSARILVDPAPESPQVLEKLLRTLQQDRLSALFLTHHHQDHHEYAPQLAKRLGVPIWLSEDTRERIVQKYGGDYFAGLEVEIKREGDCLIRWKGEPVRVYAVPGHDAGQLALAPESLRWFLVGDLIQGFGTVVIGAPEGDMASYFKTLERIITLDPAVILPSHGTPMRSTHCLQVTLQHRHEREESIRRLSAAGKTPNEILASLYQDIPSQLHPFALQNIESHLVKLRQEGRLEGG